MDGAALFAYVQRRLAEYGLTMEDDREAEIYDAITEGRDWVLRELAEHASVAVKQTVQLEADEANDRLRNFPDDTPDPYAILIVRDAGSTRTNGRPRPLTMSEDLDVDGGEYRWNSLQQLQVARGLRLAGAVEVEYVPSAEAIEEDTGADEIGVPVTCHRCVGKAAAVLLLTVDEESDASVAKGLFEKELEALKSRYGAYDKRQGAAFAPAFAEGLYEHLGDLAGG